MPAGVDEIPPNALGAFISRSHGVIDRSAGMRMVFKIPDLHTLIAIASALGASKQFRRLGPTTAQLLGVPPEDALVRFIALTSEKQAEQDLGRFNGIQ